MFEQKIQSIKKFEHVDISSNFAQRHVSSRIKKRCLESLGIQVIFKEFPGQFIKPRENNKGKLTEQNYSFNK
jgi:hypothetical protein